ncbi:MAG: type II/IV secretion system protein [Deltaproteobacteria bacterium]|nr:MAG: type II/IV secretion system protein [Deltaproteobacteria bacterium]
MSPQQKKTRRSPEVSRVGMRPAFSLEELLELLLREKVIRPEAATAIEKHATTLRSRVLKEKVGSIRSQAAARYAVSPAEIVAISKLAHPSRPNSLVDEDTVAEVMAQESGVAYHKIDPLRIDNDLVSKTLSRPFARHHAVIPIWRDAEGLCITLVDPFDTALRDQLESLIPEPLQYVVSAKRDILAIIDRVYGFRSKVKEAEQEMGPASRVGRVVQMVEVRSNDELAATNDEHVIAAVDYLLNYAYEQRASDIHLEPRTDDGVIRFRIDGILHDIETVPYVVHGAITSRIKVMAGMNIAERRRPQDGRIKTQRAEREVELRVSSMATAFGEKIVVRIFDPTVLMADVHELGLGDDERELYERWITSPNGLILVTGPTGSGKTTTLYSTLRYLSGPEINITTIEEPIELVDPRFCQVQVNPQIDITFANALRTILRQDPDIIMVGEIRDSETAKMAVQSALTGHLVFSTVHTRNAASAVSRLTELGVEPFLLSSVLRGVVAQRLIRRICERCAVEGTLNIDQIHALGLKVPVEQRESLQVRWGEGCIDCRHTGLHGRTGVFEMLDVGRRIRGLINEGKDANEIARAARIEGMESLREAALRRLADGLTTYEEIVRLTADSE